MADRSVGARYESHESEASQSSMVCCDCVSPEKSCSVVDLVCFCLALPISFCVPESLALSSIWSTLFRCGYESLCF